MTFRTASLTVLVTVLVGGAPTLVAAECGSASRAGTIATNVEQEVAMSSQRKAKKAKRDQNVGEKSGQKNYPSEHKAQGHC